MAREIKSLRHQRGMTLMGWGIAILIFAFAMMCAYRIAPPYFDNWQVQNALETLKELDLKESAFEGATDKAIIAQLSRQFVVNNVPDKLLKEAKITRTDGRVYVDLNWETRSHFLYNVDVVVYFENQFDSLNPSDCCKPKVNNSN